MSINTGTNGSIENKNVNPISRSVLVDLEIEYGPPSYGEDKPILNENFWAGAYVAMQDGILFEPREKQFYLYNSANGLFELISQDALKVRVSKLILCESPEELARQRSNAKLSAIVSMMKGQIEEPEAFAKKKNVLHLANTMLVWNGEKFEQQDFSPAFRGRNASPFHYDPDAKCDMFKEKLMGHLPEEDRQLMQLFAGQCLIGRNLLQAMLLLIGEGGSSKSAFVQTIQGVIGRSNCRELRVDALAGRFEIGCCIGKTVLIGSDVDENFFKSDGAKKLKAMVGGDPLEAEIKGSSAQMTVDGDFNVIVTSNSLPSIEFQGNGDISAWIRRLAIVMYETPFKGERINNIHELLLDREGPGILNWCVQGAEILLRQSGKLALTDNQKQRIDNVVNQSEAISLFVDECITDEVQPNHGLTTEELYDGYLIYCEEKQWRPIGDKEFRMKLAPIMFDAFQVKPSHNVTRGTSVQRGYRGVCFDNR
jgi:P4 family phage/plasmid primase-like protien